MVSKNKGDSEAHVPTAMKVVNISTFLNASNKMLISYSNCMSEIENQDRMPMKTSHERAFIKLKVVTQAYLSEFDKFSALSKSDEIPNSVEKQLVKVINEFNKDKSLNDALASARTLALLTDPPENIGFTRLSELFDTIKAAYTDFSERITEIYIKSIEQQVRIYRRK